MFPVLKVVFEYINLFTKVDMKRSVKAIDNQIWVECAKPHSRKYKKIEWKLI